jgi:hypothetical protein
MHAFEVDYLSNIDRILCSRQGEAFGILLPHFGQIPHYFKVQDTLQNCYLPLC